MENKQVPKLRFPDFHYTEGWGTTHLGELSEVVRGGSPRPIDGFLTTDTNGLNWLKIGDVDKEAKYVTQTVEKVRPEALSKTRVVKPGDLILSNSMSFGRPYILQIETCIHDGWIAITDIDKKANRDFFYYFISAPSSQSYFVDNAAGSGVQNLNAEIIKALPVCFPSTDEQQKIADCLGSLDELIAAQAQQVEALKIHKKGLMQQLFPRAGETQPHLRFPEFQNAGEWETDVLENVAAFVNEKISLEQVSLETYVSTENILPDYAGVTNASKLPTTGSVTRYKLNDILVSNIRPYLKKVWISDKEGGASNDVIVIRAKQHLLSQFLSWLLKNDVFINYVMTGAKGVKMPRGDISSMRVYPALYPSQTEQQRIADCLSSLDTLITLETQKLETLKIHKKGLMQQLFPSAQEVAA